MKILYAEDQVDIALTGEELLQEAFPQATIYTKHTASEVKASLDIAQLSGEPFDLLITDFSYPDLNGGMLGAAHIIKYMQDKNDKTPYVVLSGTDTEIIKSVMTKHQVDFSEKLLFKKPDQTAATAAKAFFEYASNARRGAEKREQVPLREPSP